MDRASAPKHSERNPRALSRRRISGSCRVTRALLARYALPRWRALVILAVVLCCTIGLQLINPRIVSAYLDTAKQGGTLDTLALSALAYLGVAVMVQVFSLAETYVAEILGWDATNELRSDLALHCLRLDMAFHKAHTPGELIERMDGDVTALATFFSRFVVYVVGNALLLVGVLIVLTRVDWRIGLAMAAIATLALGLGGTLRQLAVPRWTRARQASAALFGFIEERISGTEDLRANGATAYALRLLYKHMRELLQTERTAALYGSFTWTTMVAVLALGLATAFALGAWFFGRGTMTIGNVFLIIAYTRMLERPLEQISRQLQEFQRALASMRRIVELIGERPHIVDGRTAKLPTGALSVEFDSVAFGYEEDEPVLNDVSFRLEPGTVVGLLGKSGSGKTTVSRLLLRLYDPTHGMVRLGDVDLHDTSLADVRGRVGMVTQEVQLFHASVRDNLTLFDRTISDERVIGALREVELWDWYAALPHGLDTRLAPGGSDLSAGEAQLLAFARVFLADPGLVILDEASSRLDPLTEAKIDRAVSALVRGRTAIIIAHRLTTVDRADRIIVFEGGKIVEQGNRTTLAATTTSRFARLLATSRQPAMSSASTP
jgi:ABC-type multidrug transport system fused ATPase/permease subunit